uniref:Uncharacterized protein n=1 Tax=Amphimedon queenslandica TaxID=400682 RepID=A0A1X7SNE2_AMPQE
MNKAQDDEADNCFRVINIPRNGDKINIFDSCIYPQEPDKDQGKWSKFWHGKYLKIPDTAHKLEFCMEAHLKREYDAIEQCEIGDVSQVLERILSVHSSSLNAKKVNISDNNEIDFYDSNASE